MDNESIMPTESGAAIEAAQECKLRFCLLFPWISSPIERYRWVKQFCVQSAAMAHDVLDRP